MSSGPEPLSRRARYRDWRAGHFNEPDAPRGRLLKRCDECLLSGTRTLDDIAVDARDVVADSPMRNNKNISRDWPPTFNRYHKGRMPLRTARKLCFSATSSFVRAESLPVQSGIYVAGSMSDRICNSA